MNILSISAFYHDSAPSQIQDDQVTNAAWEDGFTYNKNDFSFPYHIITN